MIRRRKMRLYKGEFLDILKTIIMLKAAKGRYLKRFEEEFAKYIGCKYAFATFTGRNGLELILEALGLEKGDEIILPVYTLKDLILLIENKGYVPVIVDIEEDTYNINPELVKKAITKKTKAIIATHIFGSPCDIERLIDIAETHNVSVIEDCAHAAGAEYKGRRIGSFGHTAFFSLETIKPVNTFGGGMVTTNDGRIAEYIKKRIKDYPYNSRKIIFKIFYSYFEHFILHGPVYLFISFLFRFELFTKMVSSTYLFIHKTPTTKLFHYSNLQALIGLKQLRELDRRNSLRRERAEKLSALLKKSLAIQKVIPYARPVYYFFVIKTGLHFKDARKRLLREGVDVSTGSEITDDCSKVLDNFCCPVVKRVYEHAIQLPLYEELKAEDIEYIARTVNAASDI